MRREYSIGYQRMGDAHIGELITVTGSKRSTKSVFNLYLPILLHIQTKTFVKKYTNYLVMYLNIHNMQFYIHVCFAYALNLAE